MLNLGGGNEVFTVDAGATLNVTGYFFHGSGQTTGFTLSSSSGGTMVLGGVNTYVGNTQVNGGTLAVNGQITNSPVFVNPTGTLSGSGNITSSLVNSLSGGTLSPGYAGAGTLTIASGSLGINSSLNFTLGTNSTFLNVTGNLYLPGGSGDVALNVANAAGLVSGTYPLIGCGNLASGTTNDFALHLPSGDTGSLSTAGTLIDLSLTVGSARAWSPGRRRPAAGRGAWRATGTTARCPANTPATRPSLARPWPRRPPPQ